MSSSSIRHRAGVPRRGGTTRLAGCFLAVVLVALSVGTLAGHAHPEVSGQGRGRPESAGDILLHNLLVLLAVALLALLSVGLLAVLYLLTSFWLVGFQVGQSWQQHGLAPTLDGLVWHAPLELAAFTVGAATATMQSRRLWAHLLGGGHERLVVAELAGPLLRGGLMSLVLLVLAALVEASVSAGR